jgi:putative serine protease PepD
VSPRPPLTTLAALAGAALLGGAAALAGAVALEVTDGGTTTTVIRETGSAAPAAAVTGSALPVREIYRRSAPGVVQITASSAPSVQTDPFGTPFQSPGQQALGSGFVIDKAGHIVTNYHVVEGASEIEIGFSNHDTRKATIVGTDPSTDLAVLKVDASARALTPLPIADSDGVEVGHARDRQRPAARGHRAERLHDRPRHPDRRANQPGQFGRPADRHARTRDRRELADRDRR